MRIRTLALTVILLAACAPAPGTPRPPTATLTPAPTSQPPSPSATPSPSLAPTEPPCRRQAGSIEIGEIEDKALSRSFPYRIYLPPCYRELPLASYPSLYLLHGLASSDSQWDDLGIDEVATRLIRDGEIPPLLIIMPWERRGLDYLSDLPDVLLPAIEQRYRVEPHRGARAIGGLSRGAGWALRIGLQRPELFSAIGLHSPAVLTPDLYYVADWLEAIPAGQQPGLWLDIGDHDPLLRPTEELRHLLDEAGYPYRWTLDPGAHDPAYWTEHLEDYLRWYASQLSPPGG